MSSAAHEAAAGLLADVAEPVSEQPEDTAAETVQQEAEELPEDVQALLDEPDLDEEDEEEDFTVESEEEELDEYDPQKVQRLQKQLANERKRREHVEKMRVKENIKKWQAEATKYFPYADATAIEATSRRGFLKKASAEHERIKPLVEKAIASQRKALEAKGEQDQAENRQQARDAWGQPVETPGPVPGKAVEAQEKRMAALRRNKLEDAVRARIGVEGDPVHDAVKGLLR